MHAYFYIGCKGVAGPTQGSIEEDILTEISPSASATLKLAKNPCTILASFMDQKGTSTLEFQSVQGGLKWLSQMQAKACRQGSIDDVSWWKTSILSCAPSAGSMYIVRRGCFCT